MKNYILLITMHADPAMPPGYGECGGTQTYMRELLDEFGNLNLFCILITRKSMNYLPSEEQYNPNCKVIRLLNGCDEPMSKLLLHQYHDENLRKISQIIDSQEGLPCIIHSVYWNSGRLAMELSKKYRIPFVHSVISNSRGRVSRGAYEPMSQRAEYEQEIYDNANKILCVSEDEKNDLIKFYNISENKLIVCGQYVDSSFMVPSHDANGYPYVNSRINDELQKKIALKYNNVFHYHSQENFWQYKAFTYFGRLDLNKGIIQIMEAWYNCYKIYEQYCPPLWIVGGSITDIAMIREKTLEKIPELRNLEKIFKIVWWGYLNTQGLSTVLLKTQVVLMHSLYEPGGRVVVEAMCEGLPVIGTFNGFAKDFICDWKNGFLVSHGDIKSLSKRMEHFIRQPFLSDILGRQAQADAKGIVKRWSFLRNHLQAYSISNNILESEHCTEVAPNNNADIVCVFPYAEHELSNEYIEQLLSRFSSHKVISIQPVENMPNHKILQTEKENYFMKQIVPTLIYESLYNPFSNELFVTDTRKLFSVENTIQLRIQSPMFVGNDSFHRIFLYQHTETPDIKDANYLNNCLNAISNFPDIASKEEKDIFNNLLANTNVSCQNSVDNLFELLNERLPHFSFPRSGIFSAKLSWAISLWTLEYNKHIIEPELYHRLHVNCKFFSSKEYAVNSTQTRNILPSITTKNFRKYNNEFVLVGLHETSLGTVTTEISIFLYNYCKQEGISILSFIQDTKPLSVLKNDAINMDEFWSTIAYCCFWDIIISVVIYHKTPEKQLLEMEAIAEK